MTMGAAVPVNPALDLGTDDVTLCAWFKTSKGGGEGFIYIRWGGGNGGWYLKIKNGKLTTRYGIPGFFGDSVEVFSKREVADDQWHHVCAMRTKQTDVFIYLDGKFDKRMQGASRRGSVDTLANLEIGRFRKERFWDGEFDELFLIRRNLTPDEINLLMNGEAFAVESKGKLAVTWGRIKAGF